MIPSHAATADAKAAQVQTGASDLAAALALAVAGPESGYNPEAVGDSGSSFGYTQLHNNNLGDGGGLGNGYSESTLKNGVANFAIAMQYIQERLDQGAEAIDAISPWSTRHTAITGVNEALNALGSAEATAVAASPGTSKAPLVLAGVLVGIWILFG